jgi:hypothetical protein
VVKDIVKAYYEKKAKKTQGQLTADDKRYDLGKSAAAAATIQTQPALKSAAASPPVTTHAASAGPQR